MKKVLISILILSHVHALDVSFRLNPFYLLFGVFNIEAESNIFNDYLTLTASYQTGGISLFDSGYTINSYGFSANYYLNGFAKESVYIAPFFEIYDATYALLGTTTYIDNATALGAMIGQHKVIVDLVYFNYAAGWSYTNAINSPVFDGLVFDIALGLMF